MEQSAFDIILLLLAVALVIVTLFRYLKAPNVLAYLVAGVLIGPYGLGWLGNLEGVRFLAEFGLVFMLFSIGLDFSLPRLIAMRHIVVGMGGAQVFFTFAVFAVLLWWWDLSMESAIVVGGIMSLSSTAIVIKLLSDQLEQNSRHGQAAIGILLFQDLVVVPFMILIPALAGDPEHSTSYLLGAALIKSILVFAAIMAAGRWLLRPFFHEVARSKSRETFMLAVLFVSLGAAWLTHMAGLSLALGAFFAGMMISETEYRPQVEADIMPFRDMLMGLFFVTIGAMLDPSVLVLYWPWALLALAGMVLFKGLLVTVLGRIFGLESGVALRTALVLAQGGEFGFALLLVADTYKVLPTEVAQVVLAAILLSMVLAPIIVRHNGRLAKILVPGYLEARSSNLEMIRAEVGRTEGHVIICGYGRSGQNLAWMLEQEDIPSLALDLDPVRVRDARDAGKPVVYGDAARRDVLDAAGLSTARALTISFNDTHAALRILAIARAIRPDLPIIVRTLDDVDMEEFYRAGATEVVPESLEGSLMIGTHLLQLMGVSTRAILSQIGEARDKRYRVLRGFFHGLDLDRENDPLAYRQRLHSVALPDDAYANGRELSQFDLAGLGIIVTAVRRGGIRGAQPAQDMKLLGGDVLVLYGESEALIEAESRLLLGWQS